MIRTIKQEDYNQVNEVVYKAFKNSSHGYNDENNIIDKIRKDSDYIDVFELVYVESSKIIGHGLLSKVKIVNNDNELVGLVLAPLSVLPEYQNKGVGTKILLELENRAKALGYQFISILGDYDYYSKFDYVPAKNYGVLPPFEVPENSFLIKQIRETPLSNYPGILKYSKAFE